MFDLIDRFFCELEGKTFTTDTKPKGLSGTSDKRGSDTSLSFNEQFALFAQNKHTSNVFSIGKPSRILLDAGVKNNPIELPKKTLVAKQNKHGFDLSLLENLPFKINNPILILRSKESDISFIVVISGTVAGEGLASIVLTEKSNRNGYLINNIASIGGRDAKQLYYAVHTGRMIYCNKEKALNELPDNFIVPGGNHQSFATKLLQLIENPNSVHENAGLSGTSGERFGLIKELDPALSQLLAHCADVPGEVFTKSGFKKLIKGIVTPIGTVSMTQREIEALSIKFERTKNRKRYFGFVEPTLTDPYYIVKDTDGSMVFVKAFKNADEIFIAVLRSSDRMKITTLSPKTLNNIAGLLKRGHIVSPESSSGLGSDKNALARITDGATSEISQYALLYVNFPFAVFNENDGKESQPVTGRLQLPPRIARTRNVTNIRKNSNSSLSQTDKKVTAEKTSVEPKKVTDEKPSIEPVKAWNGKPKIADKTVKVSESAAIKDVLTLDKYKSEKFMTASVVYQLWKNDPDTTYHEDKLTAFQLPHIVDSVKTMLTEYDSYQKWKLSEFGSEFIRAVKARIQTFKDKKYGTTLFGISDINEQFNDELDQLIAGTLPKNHVFYLGDMSDIFNCLAIKILPIELKATRLLEKSAQENHIFKLSQLKNLPEKLNNPVMVFKSKTVVGSVVVLTELSNGKSNFVAAIELEKNILDLNKDNIRLHSVRSIYPKDTINDVLKWIESENMLLWAEKNKALDLLRRWRSNSANATQLIKSCTNVIRKFQNPVTPEEKNNALNGADKKASDLLVRCRTIHDKATQKNRGSEIKKSAQSTNLIAGGKNPETLPGALIAPDSKFQNLSANVIRNSEKTDTNNGKNNAPLFGVDDVDGLIAALLSKSEPFRHVELSDANYGREFEKGSINTPMGMVRIDKAQIHKLIRKARVNFFGLIKPTLETPLIIVKSKDAKGNERDAFIKTFTDDKTIFFVSFVKTEGELIVVSNHSRREGQMKKILSEGKVIYPADSITALLGIPNISKPNYKTLIIGLRLESLSNVIRNSEKTDTNNVKNNAPLFGLAPLGTAKRAKTSRLRGDLGKFLGEYDRHCYTIALKGDKGAGKSRLMFQLVNAYAGAKLRCAILSLEMSPESSVTQNYATSYIEPKNKAQIAITGESQDYESLSKICAMYDVVAIDSWNKVRGAVQTDFDRLQKEHPETIIISIFQSTTGKVTRGGNQPEYDAGTVIQVNTGGHAEFEKNRYASTDLVFNVFDKKLEVKND